MFTTTSSSHSGASGGPPRRSVLQRFWWVPAVAVLAAVFAAYLQPGLVIDLANRIWSCF